MKKLMSLLAALCVFYLLLAAILFALQRQLIFHPTPEVASPFTTDWSVASGTETIRVLHLGKTSDTALIYFGGNGETVSHNSPEFLRYFPLHHIYLVNYRGYGGSTGKPTEAGLFEDAVNVYDRVRQDHSKVVVMGRSLGSGVAVYLASQRDVEKLILITPYDSIVKVARRIMPWFPMSLLVRDRFESDQRVHELAVPTLIVIAERDEVIPRENSDGLVDAYPEGWLQVVVVPGAGHNDLQLHAQYWDAVVAFLYN